MPMTPEMLIELWDLEDIPACDDGIALGNEFLKSCVAALVSRNSSNFNARFESYKRHFDDCDKCKEV